MFCCREILLPLPFRIFHDFCHYQLYKLFMCYLIGFQRMLLLTTIRCGNGFWCHHRTTATTEAKYLRQHQVVHQQPDTHTLQGWITHTIMDIFPATIHHIIHPTHTAGNTTREIHIIIGMERIHFTRNVFMDCHLNNLYFKISVLNLWYNYYFSQGQL